MKAYPALVEPARRRGLANAGVALALCTLALFAPAAQGFGYGEPQVASALGQPLRLRIPVRLDPDTELNSQCVRLVSGSGSDAIPTLNVATARVLVERQGEGRYLRVDSLRPVNEPALRVIVDVGCAQHAQREFLLLLDPPNLPPQLALNAPGVADMRAPPAVAANAQVPAAGAGAPAPGTAADASGLATLPPGPQALAAVVEAVPAAPSPPPATAAQAATKPAPPRAPRPPAAKVSRNLASPQPATNADRLVIASPAEAVDPAALRLAELDKRILELSREVGQLRADLVSERERQAHAADAASAGLPWIVATLALLGLGIATILLAWQRRRTAPWEQATWGVGVPQPAAAHTGTQATAPSSPPAPVPAPGGALSDTARAPTLGTAMARRPRPCVTTPLSYDEIIGAASTTTPGSDSQQGQIEVTEMHVDDLGLGRMHTVFLDPGSSLDTPPVFSSNPPAGLGPATPAPDLRAALHTIDALPPMPEAGGAAVLPAPDVLASPGLAAPVLQDSPCTQTPTLLLLDLDLSTQALLHEELAEAAAAAAPAAKGIH